MIRVKREKLFKTGEHLSHEILGPGVITGKVFNGLTGWRYGFLPDGAKIPEGVRTITNLKEVIR
jgi:hypothetical protein